jgi:parvulin-like peptidyl-prolyl isomerase
VRIPMRLRSLVFVLPFVLLVAACGGASSAKLASGDVAVVGNQHITKKELDRAMALNRIAFRNQGRAFPKAGSTQYASLRQQVIAALVQNAEYAIEAAKLGIKVTAKDIAARLASIKKQYFGGSEKTYRTQIAKQGFTDAEVRDQIRIQLLTERLYEKVTANVTPSPSEVQAYYKAHISQYVTQKSRGVRYILLGKNKQALAQSLAARLRGASDATWCALAKRYSQDPSTKGSCGKATFQQGQTVPEFDKQLFSLPTSRVVAVDTAKYGWFVLQPTTAVKPPSVQTEQEAAPTIEQQLSQQDRNQAMTDWVTRITKSFCTSGQVTYAVGYQPEPDPCSSLQTATNTTTT